MTKPQNSELLFYTDQGQGEVVVLLHGFLEDHSMWDNFVTALAKSARHSIDEKEEIQVESPT